MLSNAPTAALPQWFNADRLQWVAVAAMVLLVVLGLLVARFVQRMVAMMLSLALIGGLLVALWVQRTDLQDCQQTCSCRLFGQDVDIPDNALCGDRRLQLQTES